MFNFLKQLFSLSVNPEVQSALQSGALMIDVRTPAEFAAGNVAGSINIPLAQITQRLHEFKTNKPIIVFCQSGNRSGQAKTMLNRSGINEVINGGAWTDINKLLQKIKDGEIIKSPS